MNTIGARVKHYRELRQFDHKKLAAFTGISPNDIAAVELGNRPLSHEEVKLLARALEISVDDLFGQGNTSASSSAPTESSALIPAAQLAALLDQMNK